MNNILSRNNRGRSGVTLVEILVAVFILTIGILSCLLYFSTALRSTELARDITTATTHCESVLEDMRARSTLSAIVTQDWPAWAEANGLTALPDEDLDVVFAEPTADPLDIKVTVSWNRKSRANEVVLRTELTK